MTVPKLGLTASHAVIASRFLKPYKEQMLGESDTKDPRQSGHSAAECIEPRSAEGVECKKCSEGTYYNYLSFSFDALISNPYQLVISRRTVQPEVAELAVTASK